MCDQRDTFVPRNHHADYRKRGKWTITQVIFYRENRVSGSNFLGFSHRKSLWHTENVYIQLARDVQ